MKRILVVLLFAAVASAGFSVTGQVYTRLLPGGGGGDAPGGGLTNEFSPYGEGPTFYIAEWWANCNPTPLADLRVGRQGTGVDINFDTFTFTYKLRQPLYGNDLWIPWQYSTNNTQSGDFNVGNIQDVYGSTVNAMSPGYFQLSGLKAGADTFSIGASWWTAEYNSASATSNGGSGTLSTASAMYNMLALDLTYDIPIAGWDFHADPWNKVTICFYGGSATNCSSTTNGVNVSGFGAIVPLNIDYSSGPFSITIECKWIATSSSVITVSSTNAGFSSQIGAVAKMNFTINSLFGAFLDVGIVSINDTTTNGGAGGSWENGLLIPTLFGVSLTAAPGILTYNIGYGVMIPVGLVSSNGSGITSNYTVPETEYDWYEIHAYHHPFINIGADTKFANDWTAGLRFIVYLESSAGTGDDGPYLQAGNSTPNNNTSTTVGATTTYSSSYDWLQFNNIGDWDPQGGSSAYLGYSKDNFSVKCWTSFGDDGQAGGTATSAQNGLLGLFGAIDVSIKF